MRTIVLLFVYSILVLLLIPLLLFCQLIKSGRPVILIGKGAMKVGQLILGIRLEVLGRENIDKKKPYIFMSNHLSFLDGPLLFMLIPQPVRVILKKEVFKIPFVGLGMKQVEFVPVDRKSIRGGKRSIERATRLIKEKGFSFLIFPEGTRSLDGNIQKFKRGGFFLAVNSQAPIVPISIKGSYELMPKGRKLVRKGKIKVVFHPLVSVYGLVLDDMPKLMDEVKDTIESGLKD